MLSRLWPAVCVLTLSLLAATLSSAATYYVAPTGDDTAAGTEAAPLQTLEKAGTLAQPGDTVLVKTGVYLGPTVLSCHGAKGAPITFRPAGDGPVKLQGKIEQVQGFALAPGKRKTYVASVTGPVAAVTADLDRTPLVVDGLQRVGTADAVEAGARRWCYDQNAGKLYVNYLNAPFEPKHAMYLLRDADGVGLYGSWLTLEGFAVTGFAGDGIDLSNANHATLRNLRVSQCGYGGGAAIDLYESDAATVEDCVLFRCETGLALQDFYQTKVLHNTICRTRAYGITTCDESKGAIIRDNIICGGGRSGAALYVGRGGDKNLQLDYNCLAQGRGSVLVNWVPLHAEYRTFREYRGGVPYQDVHSVSADPLFREVKLCTEDFRLRKESPCRGKADDGTDMGARGTALVP